MYVCSYCAMLNLFVDIISQVPDIAENGANSDYCGHWALDH